MKKNFDYIIIGAGSAGCVLANRLAKDKKKTVNSKKDDYQGSPLEPLEPLPPLFLETELNTRTFPYEHHYSNEDNEKDVKKQLSKDAELTIINES